jgi:N-acetylglucosaminyl-diphospho-decaprenol L-rhamnosyltransferase
VSSSLHIVVVNWNTGGYLRRCLASIASSRLDGVELVRVTVVDNDSADGSADGLDGISLPLEVVRNRHNAGFGAACNQGAAGSTADYLLFLNPDTRLRADTLATAVRFMDSPEAHGVGICGARVVDETGAPANAAARFPTLRIIAGKITGLDRVVPRLFPSHRLGAAELDRSRPVDQVIGAFFLVRRELFERLGGFDRRYFIYYEEVDLALRARRLEARSHYLHEAVVIHAENTSSRQVPALRLYHSQRSRLLFALAHWPRGHTLALLALTFTVEPAARLVKAVLDRDRGAASEALAATRRLARELLRHRGRFGQEGRPAQPRAK